MNNFEIYKTLLDNFLQKREQKFAKTIEKVSNMWYKKYKLRIF